MAKEQSNLSEDLLSNRFPKTVSYKKSKIGYPKIRKRMRFLEGERRIFEKVDAGLELRCEQQARQVSCQFNVDSILRAKFFFDPILLIGNLSNGYYFLTRPWFYTENKSLKMLTGTSSVQCIHGLIVLHKKVNFKNVKNLNFRYPKHPEANCQSPKPCWLGPTEQHG